MSGLKLWSLTRSAKMGFCDSYKPVIAMIGLQFCYAGVALFTKAALSQGMSPRIFVVHRQAIATLVMAPFVLISIRRHSWRFPTLGIKCFGWMLVASLFGVTANQNAYFEGLHLASSTAASAMTNLIPAITFVMAIISGMEKVKLRSVRSTAKIIGTVCCVGGAICMALMKGPKLLNSVLLPLKPILNPAGEDTWLLGCFCLFASSCFWATWMILQVPISEGCPDLFYSSAMMCFLATLESTAIALLVEKDLAVWKLNPIEIGSCLYSVSTALSSSTTLSIEFQSVFILHSWTLNHGVGQALSFFVQTWCISKRGPLFAAMFNPLCTVIVTIFAAIILREVTYTGSLVGALIVILGLYLVLWGKAKDLEATEKQMMNENPQKYEPENVQILVDDCSAQKSCKLDLEEPLLSQKSNNV